VNSQEHFQKELQEYLDEYESVLGHQLTSSSVTKHLSICNGFIDGILNSDTSGFEDLNGSDHGSKLLKWFNDNTQEGISLRTYKNTLKRWFYFIRNEHGIENKKWMEYLADLTAIN
jgi:hypothetical protein